jgi:hypothetical protein
MPAYGPTLTLVIAGQSRVPKNPATPSKLPTQNCVIVTIPTPLTSAGRVLTISWINAPTVTSNRLGRRCRFFAKTRTWGGRT